MVIICVGPGHCHRRRSRESHLDTSRPKSPECDWSQMLTKCRPRSTTSAIRETSSVIFKPCCFVSLTVRMLAILISIHLKPSTKPDQPTSGLCLRTTKLLTPRSSRMLVKSWSRTFRIEASGQACSWLDGSPARTWLLRRWSGLILISSTRMVRYEGKLSE